MILIETYMLLPKEQRQIHISLDELCVERGGNHNNFRGVLVEYLNTSFPVGMSVHCCHACNNQKCSNPRHLYWGTAKENTSDTEELRVQKLREVCVGRSPWNRGIKTPEHTKEKMRKSHQKRLNGDVA